MKNRISFLMFVVTLVMISGAAICSEDDCSSYKNQNDCNRERGCSWFKGTVRSYCEKADCSGYNDSESSCGKATKCEQVHGSFTREQTYDCTGTGYGAKPRTCTRDVSVRKFIRCAKKR